MPPAQMVAVERRFLQDAAGRVLEQALLESARLGMFGSTIISAATMAAEAQLADVDIPATIWRSFNLGGPLRT